MAAPTWHERELPILEALAAREEQHPLGVSLDEVAEQAGLPRERAAIAVGALIDDGYVAGSPVHDQAGDDWLGLKLRGDGRRAVRQWPVVDDAGKALLAVLEQRLEKEDDPEKRGALEGMLRSARQLTGTVLREVTVAWGRQVLGPS